MEGLRRRLQLVSWVWIVAVVHANQVFETAKNCRPPSISSKTSVLSHFIENEKTTIPCIANGTGSLGYKWEKDGESLVLTEQMRMDEGQGSLTFYKPQAEDKGSYQCIVSNDCGTALSLVTDLKQSKMDPFSQQKNPVETTAIAGTGKVLTCNPPYSEPKATITWILLKSPEERRKAIISPQRKGTKNVNSVVLDNRITMDYEGNLYITNVQKKDEQGGRTYVCQAENESTRSAAKGSDKVLKVIESPDKTAMKRPPQLMWQSEKDITGIEGGVALMKCIFSGNPVPMVTWTRSGKELDPEHHNLEYPMELYIKEVLRSDEGTYSCTGTNKHGSITHSFNLKVHALPMWQDQPHDTTVGPEEGAEFKCRATGIPEPTIEWFINSEPLKTLPPDPKRELDGYTLRFKELEMSDSQVIQCNASNEHGYIFADVYLFVEAMAPVIERGPLKQVIVAEERELHVTCQMKGKPKPTVVWYKGNQPLKLERYQYQDNGDLIIAVTNKKDSGDYRCKVTNRFGSEWASGNVQVREKTQILSKPDEKNVTFSNDATFKCGAKTDPLESENLRYKWLKDGEPIQPNSHIIVERGKLIIKDTTSKDSANYTCVADNGLDSDSASAMLRVKAKPEPPRNVNVSACQPKQAILSWYFDESMSNFQEMDKFVVESLTQFDEEEELWQHATVEAVHANTRTTKYETTIPLAPYAHYKFRVRAVNALGMGLPSEATKSWCKTPRSMPEKNPENVRSDEQNTGYLVIKWDPLKRIDLYGPNFTYIIEVQKQGESEVDEYEVDDYTIGEKWIPVNDTYQPYIFRVRSRNQVGKAMQNPKSMMGYSGEGVPLVTPGNFELDPTVDVTATSATFRWDAVNTSVEAMQGEFSGYKIRFWKVGEKDTTMRSFIVEKESKSQSRRKRRQSPEDDGKVRGTVKNLPSYSQLEADVVAINKNFESNGSNVIPLETPEGVPGPVAYLEAINRGSHHFLLHWAQPKEPNGIITGYQISYRKIKKLDFLPETTAFDNLKPDTVRVILNGLEPDSQYRIYIKAFTKEGQGKEYFIDVRTNSDVVDMALPVVQHVVAGETGANITFDILSPSKSSRYGQLYKIEYKKKKADRWELSDEPVEEGLMWGSLDHLEPNEQYQVRILALAHDGGDTRPSEPYTFKTAGFGAKQGTFLTAAWFIGMMVAIAILILFLIIVCIIKRNRGDNYPVQEKERLRGNCDDNQDHFNGFGKPDENGLGASSSFDQDVEKVPLDAESDSLDYGDDDASKFNEDGSFIGQYGRGEKANDPGNSSSIV
ncbi:hypothetical protein RRG08_029124 [Elysia crispata]|uniref:Uncharacterized protein n=1 Tax=Elysia crispata TaxID=231223 RepID=A0AAE1CTI5_9GAST|nr:hypothetical protein RRG08_029124 [Elysia crispata]